MLKLLFQRGAFLLLLFLSVEHQLPRVLSLVHRFNHYRLRRDVAVAGWFNANSIGSTICTSSSRLNSVTNVQSSSADIGAVQLSQEEGFTSTSSSAAAATAVGRSRRGSGRHSQQQNRNRSDAILKFVLNYIRTNAANNVDSPTSATSTAATATAAVAEQQTASSGQLWEKRKPTITEMNLAITAAGRKGLISESLEIFSAITSVGYLPDLMSYNNAIWSAGNAGSSELAMRLFQQLQRHPQLAANEYTYGALMHGFAHSRSYKQALQYLDQMERAGVRPNKVVFTSAMEACAEAGQHKYALAVMERCIQSGLQPDLTMSNSAIKACCLAGAMDEAEILADSVRKCGAMDVFTYHTLMMGHTKIGRHQRVLQLFYEAVQSPAALDGGVYSLAMLAALNAQLPKQVPLIAEQAHANAVRLTLNSYTTLIRAFAELGFPQESVRCLDTMRLEDDLQPNVFTFAAAISACRDDPAQVLLLLQRMEAEGVLPNTVALTAAINALARGGDKYTDTAVQILRVMEQHGPEPNMHTYNTVLRAFAETGRVQEALSILSAIKEHKLKPDRYTLTCLLLACGRSNNSDNSNNSNSDATAAVEATTTATASSAGNTAAVDIKGSSSSDNYRISGIVKSNSEVPTALVDQIDFVLQLMKQNGVQPDEIAYGAAMDAYRRVGNSLKALECLNEMRRAGLEPTATHYNLIIRTMRQEGYADKIFKFVHSLSMKEERALLNGNTFEISIEALLDASKWQEALTLLRTMDQYGCQPSVRLCVALVQQLERARQYKAVLALYRYMVNKGYDFYENSLLNDVFKRLVDVASTSINVVPSLSQIKNRATAGSSNNSISNSGNSGNNSDGSN